LVIKLPLVKYVYVIYHFQALCFVIFFSIAILAVIFSFGVGGVYAIAECVSPQDPDYPSKI